MNPARDGELPARERRALERHLDRCESCRTERVALEGVLAALDALPREAAVPARVEDRVFRRVRGLAEEAGADPTSVSTWVRGLVPAIAATTVVVVAAIGTRNTVGPAPVTSVAKTVAAGVERTVVARRAKARVPDEPPAALASRPDLFVDLPMLRELDKLQHFDTIATMDDDDQGPPGDGAPPSNG